MAGSEDPVSRVGPRSGPCASSDDEPRQGRKAAALSRSCAVPQALRAAVGCAKRQAGALRAIGLARFARSGWRASRDRAGALRAIGLLGYRAIDLRRPIANLRSE